MVHREGYSVGCVLVGLEVMDAAPESENDMDNAKLDRLCTLLERLLDQRGAAEDAECDCDMPGGKHAKNCACYGEAEDEVIPISSIGGQGNVNPVSASDARAALQNLRKLRGFVEANGSSQAIGAYNSAIKALKVQIALDSRASAFDSRSVRSRREADAAEFEASAARFHGKALVRGETPTHEHRAEDTEHPEESFEEACARVGKDQREKFTPKRRR